MHIRSLILAFIIPFYLGAQSYVETTVCFEQGGIFKDQTLKEIASNLQFAPSRSGGGVETVLTLTGEPFGDEKGKVQFSNSSGTLFYVLESSIVSWSSSQVKVYVPAQAGTGKVAVERADGTLFESSASLFVPYTNSNFNYDTDGDGIYEYKRTRHVNENKVLYYIQGQFSSSQLNIIEQSIEHISCNSGKEIDLLPYSGEHVTGDGISTLSIVDGPGLARTSAVWTWCTETLNFIRAEGDIGFDPGGLSFKVMVHEGLHWLGMGHVRQSSSILYPTTSGGNVMSPDDIEGSVVYTTFSNQSGDYCGTHTQYDKCSTLSVRKVALGRLAKETYYDMYGRGFSDLKSLPVGVYVKVSEYERGIEAKKILKD